MQNVYLGASYNNVRLRFPKKESVDQERSKQVVEDDQKTSWIFLGVNIACRKWLFFYIVGS